MSAQQNTEIFRRVIEEAFNQQQYAVLHECFKPGYVEHQFGISKTVEGMENDINFLHRAFPDFHLEIEDLVADGDKVWMRATARGTNTGGLMGPPNGKSFEIAVFDVLRFADDLVVEHWGAPDRFAQLAQLGLLPQTRPDKVQPEQNRR